MLKAPLAAFLSLPKPDPPLFCSALQIYKSTKCNDMQQSGSCPRGPFCAFAHVDRMLFPLPWGSALSPLPSRPPSP